MQQLDELKEVHKEMVRLEMEGKSRKQIGELLDMNPQVVGRLLYNDKLIDEYRKELEKEREGELKRAKVRARLRLADKIEGLVDQMHKIAIYGDTDTVKLNACIKGLQLVGMKFDGVEDVLEKAPRIIIRDKEEKVENDGIKKSLEGIGDESKTY